jgi:GNAT superfamily N-acetyltransferase
MEVKNMEIRAFTEKDAEDTAKVIAETLRISNRRDYTAEQIEAIIAGLSAEELIKVSKERHMYVICDGERIIGTGGIAGYWGSLIESILLTIFILPEYQGKGIGRKLIETLEKDEYFLRAKRIEIPASLTAVEFYRKMGYDFKDGISEPEDGIMYRLEKFR